MPVEMVGTVTGKDQTGIEIEIGTGRGTVGDHGLQRIGNDGARVRGTTTGAPQKIQRAPQLPEKTQHLIKNVNQFLLKNV
jgi:hypothetical protein